MNQNKYKIGFFSDTYHPQLNGVVSSIDSFDDELTNQGHIVYIFAPDYNNKGPEKDKPTVLRFPSVSYPFYKEFRVSWPYSRNYNKFKKLNIDIYHLHSPFSIGILGFFLSKLYKAPVIMTYHTLWKEYGPRYAPYLPKTLVEFMAVTMSKSFCNRLDLVIAPSKAMKKEIESYGLKTKVEVVPTGLTLHKWEFKSKLNIKKDFNIPENKKIITFVGRIGSEKNVFLLLESYKLVLEKDQNTHLIVVGDGPILDDCKELATELGINEHVTFTGLLSREDVLKTMKDSDIFAFPSITETQGIVILEALACGLPTVAANRMGSIDYLEDGKGGILTEPNKKAFAKGILAILNLDKKAIERIKEEAIEKAQNYTTEAVTEKLIDIYHRVYNQKKGNKR